ncbi:hypothetical protein HETIRDRAFT_427290 [Heterobasidion irregulare TC 32-1]|uniref:Uncharacterized protein n=1 Tax=Heterobasidion irregulare (strain TC 32-1) TaxID=747525 RepID=W4K8K7_HETIT|nr:uncharacterized protein HETIRDRAFT_427290 [Heterobasidion irregulare TC 32-1]ETW82167.1 hypothetical protein HETIRDRAFT_427290 [Heterobasidion irregulare TC 32-1]
MPQWNLEREKSGLWPYAHNRWKFRRAETSFSHRTSAKTLNYGSSETTINYGPSRMTFKLPVVDISRNPTNISAVVLMSIRVSERADLEKESDSSLLLTAPFKSNSLHILASNPTLHVMSPPYGDNTAWDFDWAPSPEMSSPYGSNTAWLFDSCLGVEQDDYPGNTEVWPSEKEEEEPDDTNRNPHARVSIHPHTTRIHTPFLMLFQKRAGSKTAMRFTRGKINPTGEGRTPYRAEVWYPRASTNKQLNGDGKLLEDQTTKRSHVPEVASGDHHWIKKANRIWSGDDTQGVVLPGE